jgi:hypothetical protein
MGLALGESKPETISQKKPDAKGTNWTEKPLDITAVIVAQH